MPIAHQELGSPDAPVLVLLHGLGSSGRSWEKVAPLLASRYRVIVPDLPGFGETGGAPETITGMARAVLELLDPGEFVAVGHSMGGLVATALAELEPDRVTRLVLVNAPPSWQARTAARGVHEQILALPVIGKAVWNGLNEAKWRKLMASAFAPGFDVPGVFVEDVKRSGPKAFTRTSREIDLYLKRRPLAARVGSLTQQAFVIFGERDGRVDPASLDGYGPVANATVATIPEAGHTPIWEAPDRTAELILTGAGAR